MCLLPYLFKNLSRFPKPTLQRLNGAVKYVILILHKLAVLRCALTYHFPGYTVSPST